MAGAGELLLRAAECIESVGHVPGQIVKREPFVAVGKPMAL